MIQDPPSEQSKLPLMFVAGIWARTVPGRPRQSAGWATFDTALRALIRNALNQTEHQVRTVLEDQVQVQGWRFVVPRAMPSRSVFK